MERHTGTIKRARARAKENGREWKNGRNIDKHGIASRRDFTITMVSKQLQNVYCSIIIALVAQRIFAIIGRYDAIILIISICLATWSRALYAISF